MKLESVSLIGHRTTIALALTLLLCSSAAAQSAPSELQAGVGIVPPFVMQENGTLTGFSIDLWNAIAERLKLKTNYRVMPDAASLLAGMRSKEIDIVVSPVVVTVARDEEFDFSLPIVQSGFAIMVRDTGQTATTNPLEDLLRLLFSRTTVVWLAIALVLILVPAHLVWWFERSRGDGIIADKRYFPGIFEAMYWAVSCLTAQAETMPHQWIARLFSVFWMFAGVVFVAFYTAQLTTTLTVGRIQGAINGPDDLPGKQVGTIAGSTAADYLKAQNAQVVEFNQSDDVFKALLSKRVDAVVFASPVLLYYAAHKGKGLVKIVGSEFNVAPISFGFQLDNPLRRKVNGALLALRENGSYQRLYDKWFGGP